MAQGLLKLEIGIAISNSRISGHYPSGAADRWDVRFERMYVTTISFLLLRLSRGNNCLVKDLTV